MLKNLLQKIAQRPNEMLKKTNQTRADY